MGRPLAHIPDQVGDCHASYARHHAQTFIDVFAGLGIHPDVYYWMSDIYPTGQMDPFIRTALDRAEIVRDVYRRVSKVERPAGWLPVQAVCPSCGKVGTTIALDWDGETVRVECRPDYVTWAHGCGFTGRISPFGGTSKLYWNLEWAAQWSLFGVTIEPNGKDLATAGGSRDRADAIAREVFEREPPLNFPYEFLNLAGKKMSTSKGLGAAAHTIGSVVPAGAAPLPVRPEPPGERDGVRPGGDRRRPAPVRRVRPAGRRDRRPRGQGRAAGWLRLDLPVLAARPRRGRRAGRGRLPPRLRAPRAARPGAGRGRRGAGRGGEGRAPDGRRGRRAPGPASPPSAAGSRPTPRNVR